MVLACWILDNLCTIRDKKVIAAYILSYIRRYHASTSEPTPQEHTATNHAYWIHIHMAARQVTPPLEVARNWNEIEINIEFIGSIVTCSAKRSNIPTIVEAIRFLNMSTNEIRTIAP